RSANRGSAARFPRRYNEGSSRPQPARVVRSAAPSHNLATLLLESARRHPALSAVSLGPTVLHDYATLAVRVSRLAATLAGSGLQRGERVVLIAHNTPGYVEALFACWQAGLCAVPINSKLHASELAYVLEHSGARWAFADDAWHAVLAERPGSAPALERIVAFDSSEYAELFGDARCDEPAPVRATDAAWLFYTSGTTGRPKGAVLSHGNLRAMSECFLGDVEAVAAGDAILHAAPM